MPTALASPDGLARYRWSHQWNPALPRFAFVLLRPQPLDAEGFDSPARACVQRATLLGAGGVELTWLFTRVATDSAARAPDAAAADPAADAALLSLGREAGSLICAWGSGGQHDGRAARAVALLQQAGVQLTVLALTADGAPASVSKASMGRRPRPWDGRSLLLQQKVGGTPGAGR